MSWWRPVSLNHAAILCVTLLTSTLQYSYKDGNKITVFLITHFGMHNIQQKNLIPQIVFRPNWNYFPLVVLIYS